MNPLVRRLFHELADLSHTERRAVFANQTIPQEVRSEVESLLGFDSLAHPYSTHWGPYRAVDVLGMSGMSTVYLAERADGEIQQKVAMAELES